MDASLRTSCAANDVSVGRWPSVRPPGQGKLLILRGFGIGIQDRVRVVRADLSALSEQKA